MKLIIVAALVAACSAGRLEHLERGYLPPDGANGLGFGTNGRQQNGFGPNGQVTFGSHDFGSGRSSGGNGFGAHTGPSPFGANGSPGSDAGFRASNGFGLGSSSGNGLGAAASNQYLPPDHGPSAFNGLSGSGISAYRAPSGQYRASSFGTNNGLAGQRASSQFPQGLDSQPHFGGSNQYLTPKQSSAFQNIPQQSFDERTGYNY